MAPILQAAVMAGIKVVVTKCDEREILMWKT